MREDALEGNVGAFERLRDKNWPEAFNLNMAARLLETNNDTAAIYLARWRRRGMIASAGDRAGVYFNLVANPRAAEERLADAIVLTYPTAVLTGESVLHNVGWITQIPQKLQVACLARRTFPVWDGAEFHGRPRAFFEQLHGRFVRPEKAKFTTHGLRSLTPADALADMYCSPGHWRPEADDIDIPDEDVQLVGDAFERRGISDTMPDHIRDRLGHKFEVPERLY